MNRPIAFRFDLILASFLSFLLAGTTGCETKSHARAQAAEAYMAGQQQAQDHSAPKPQLVTVKGPVENPILPWTEDLTLKNAILAANYTGFIGPRLIRVTRNGITSEIKPSELLQGLDFPLQAGDVIEIVP